MSLWVLVTELVLIVLNKLSIELKVMFINLVRKHNYAQGAFPVLQSL